MDYHWDSSNTAFQMYETGAQNALQGLMWHVQKFILGRLRLATCPLGGPMNLSLRAWGHGADLRVNEAGQVVQCFSCSNALSLNPT